MVIGLWRMTYVRVLQAGTHQADAVRAHSSSLRKSSCLMPGQCSALLLRCHLLRKSGAWHLSVLFLQLLVSVNIIKTEDAFRGSLSLSASSQSLIAVGSRVAWCQVPSLMFHSATFFLSCPASDILMPSFLPGPLPP